MMRRFDVGLSLAVCFAAMIWGAVAHAEPGDFVGLGAGQDSCGRFIASIGNAPPGSYRSWNTAKGVLVSENKEYQEWLAGFISGINVMVATIGKEEQQVRPVDGAGLDLWMRNWCNKHPTNPVVEGAMAFVNEMRTNAAASRR
jgi:hypothetical protein